MRIITKQSHFHQQAKQEQGRSQQEARARPPRGTRGMPRQGHFHQQGQVIARLHTAKDKGAATSRNEEQAKTRPLPPASSSKSKAAQARGKGAATSRNEGQAKTRPLPPASSSNSKATHSKRQRRGHLQKRGASHDRPKFAKAIAVKLVQEVHVALSPWCQFEGERKVHIGLQALSAAPRGPSSQRAPSNFTWHQALGGFQC